ncbi:MAG: hypothetical protein IKH57_21370 [Clostridia bacterium]|nr:hypothetical protein [Clostridia bacterium]
MKGFIDKDGRDMPPCDTCKNRNLMTINTPCYDCISIVDLAIHKPNYETEFAAYEKEEEGYAAHHGRDRTGAAALVGAGNEKNRPQAATCGREHRERVSGEVREDV